jgi:hypothetical protein
VADEKLATLIAQEARELAAAPVIRPVVGMVKRCHICGQVFSANELKLYDTHVPQGKPREACPRCHPDRNIT